MFVNNVFASKKVKKKRNKSKIRLSINSQIVNKNFCLWKPGRQSLVVVGGSIPTVSLVKENNGWDECKDGSGEPKLLDVHLG